MVMEGPEGRGDVACCDHGFAVGDGGVNDRGMVRVGEEGDDDICVGDGGREDGYVSGEDEGDGGGVGVIGGQALGGGEGAAGDGEVEAGAGEGLNGGMADETRAQEEGAFGG